MLLRHSQSPEKLRRHTTLLEDEINSIIIKLKQNHLINMCWWTFHW